MLTVAAGLAAGMSARDARADFVVLNNGNTIFGEVISESETAIRFRCRINDIWTTVVYRRTQINRYEREEGDQSDLSETEESGEERPPANPTKPTTPTKPSGGPTIAVIPLHGQVGGLVDGNIKDTFDAALLQACFEAALENNAKLVILDIDSPGGLASEMEMICETIINWHDRLRIVAFPTDAYSAAAIISLSCKEVAVRPDSRIGAATIVQRRGGGTTAVDAKMASPHYAKQRQYMASSGQPYEVVQAMTIQETVLWFSPTAGFFAGPGRPPGDDWSQIDSRTTILTLTADEAVAYGVASEMAGDVEALVEALGVDERASVDVYDDEVRRYTLGLDRRLDELRTSFDGYFTGLGDLRNAMNNYLDAARRRNRQAIDRYKADINSSRGKVLSFSRRIQRVDRSLLARRVDVPEVIIERLEEDAKLLGRIKRLIDEKTIEGFNEAAQRLNEVLTAWRELL